MPRYIEEFLNLGPGRPFYPSNLHIDYYKPLKQQVNILREDMLFVDYGNDALNYVIDVGWYGRSFSLNGGFTVRLIKNGDWQNPLLRARCKSVKRLVPAMQLCLNRLRRETANFRLLPIS